MPTSYQLGEELQEEGQRQESYVHTVVIGIGSDDHTVVAQAVETVFDVERSLEEVKLFVLIDHLFTQPVAVEWFASQAKDRLVACVSTLCDRPTSRVTFRDKDTGQLRVLSLRIVVVLGAVT